MRSNLTHAPPGKDLSLPLLLGEIFKDRNRSSALRAHGAHDLSLIAIEDRAHHFPSNSGGRRSFTPFSPSSRSSVPIVIGWARPSYSSIVSMSARSAM